jgi:hypothetical protein
LTIAFALTQNINCCSKTTDFDFFSERLNVNRHFKKNFLILKPQKTNNSFIVDYASFGSDIELEREKLFAAISSHTVGKDAFVVCGNSGGRQWFYRWFTSVVERTVPNGAHHFIR